MKSTLKQSDSRRTPRKLGIIKTREQYDATMARVAKIFDAQPGTDADDELELLLLLVEKYEDKEFPIGLPSPVAAIRFRMDQGNLQPKDLVPFIGSKSKVSEVLSGRRQLSLSMIRNLVAHLGIPAEVLLQVAPAVSSHPKRPKAKSSN